MRISCCINNLTQHRYGGKLNELAAEGADIALERCHNQCVGCRRYPAFMANGLWHAVPNPEHFKETVYAKAGDVR
ncbi:hypothetical protein [Cohnella sp. GCM10027633]|uniref:hypothetical protein n=1 Tax=unclassified Cohnella TaxID=2636738 RepID=UPI00362C5FE9